MIIGVLRRGEEAHGCSGVLGVLGRLRAGDNVRPGARVLAGRQCGGELDSLNQACCLPKDGPGGSPAAAPMRRTRRRGSPRRRGEMGGCVILLSKMQAKPGGGCPWLEVTKARGARREGSSLPIPRPASRQLQLQISLSSPFFFSQRYVRAGAAWEASGSRALQRCPSRRPRGAAPCCSRAAPRGSLSLLHLQDGRRRLHTSHKETRP